MNTANQGYLAALRAHADECDSDLTELRRRLDEGPWSRFDEKAAERTLQVLIESAIGAAKHWSKKTSGQVSTDAYTAFRRLAEQGLIESADTWRAMIGLRNALVHDYLEVDPDIIASVLRKKQYEAPLLFVRQAVKALG